MSITGWDLETHLSQPGLAAPPIVVASVASARVTALLDPAQNLTWLRSRLTDPTDHIVGTNIAYDLVCSAAADPTLLDLIFAALDEGRIHDIAIREALIDIAKGELADRGEEGIGIRYGMTLLAKRYLNLDLSADKRDGWRKRYAMLEGTPIEQWPWAARIYPMRDAAFPLEIFHMQDAVPGRPNLHDEPAEVRAAFALMLMSVWGTRSAAATCAKLRARVEAEDRKSTQTFRAHGFLRENGTENQAVIKARVTAAYNGNPPRTSPSGKFPQGQVATDRDTCSESGDPVLEHWGRAGKNDKYLTTYLEKVEAGRFVPWNPQFNVLVATTRVSSDAQQFPKTGGVRECFCARPGCVICSVDYGGLELRTMSQRAIWEIGYSRMADALNSGQDPHLIAAASFMGTSYADAVARKKEPTVKTFRDLGKIWNFGKGGGMGPPSMVFNAREGKNGETTTGPDGRVYVGSRFCILLGRAERCGERMVEATVKNKKRQICAVCVDVARELDAGWLKAWPEQAALFQRASRAAKATRYLEAMIPVVNVKRGKCGYTQWLNTPFQGLGAAATKRAMWLVCREMYTDRRSDLWGSRLLLNVHDELIAELPREIAAAAGDRMGFIMRETLKEFVPDLARSVEADPALCLTMNKSMATVRDIRGKLLVWDDHDPRECHEPCKTGPCVVRRAA